MPPPQTIPKKVTLYKRLGITSAQLAAFCQRWQITELALFGSILREDFCSTSDIDLLVTYQPAAQRGLIEKITMQEELENMVNHKVDLVSKKAIEKSRNWIRRQSILSNTEVIYVSRSEASPLANGN